MYPRPAQGRIRQWRIPLGAQAYLFAMRSLHYPPFSCIRDFGFYKTTNNLLFFK